jgi:hypothetical protein
MLAAMNARAVILVLAAACGGSPKEVAVEGTDQELVKLAGDWQGNYTGNESGRSGTVQFSLQLGRHVADGQVIMGGATPLKIEFVAVKGGQVKGTIAPYTDPNCTCQVETSFLGNIAGDKISGMFETKISKTGQIQTGSWSVSRTK